MFQIPLLSFEFKNNIDIFNTINIKEIHKHLIFNGLFIILLFLTKNISFKYSYPDFFSNLLLSNYSFFNFFSLISIGCSLELFKISLNPIINFLVKFFFTYL